MRRLLGIAGAMILALGSVRDARAWESRTHRLITRLAIEALPSSSLRSAFLKNERALEEYSVEPDSVLKPRYGRAEQVHHYIDLERLGSDPFAKLNPDLSEMEHRYGRTNLEKTGTLPWTVEDYARAVSVDVHQHDCAALLRDAGYLAHYVGDASMPLHSTVFYDGYSYRDRGVHIRIEQAADDSAAQIERAARPQVKPENIGSVWNAVIAELKRAHLEVARTIESDRSISASAGRNQDAYDRALAMRDLPFITSQIADGASVLAAIWLFEWRQAGSPQVCDSRF